MMKNKSIKYDMNSKAHLLGMGILFFCLLLLLPNKIWAAQAENGYVYTAPVVEDNSARVYDMADVLTEEEESKLEDKIQKAQEKRGYNIVVVTTDDNPTLPETYADDFWDANGFGPDGILFLLDMGNRQQWISTAGVCLGPIDEEEFAQLKGQEKRDIYTEYDIESILDFTTGPASDGDYYKCFVEFINEVKNHGDLMAKLVPTPLSVLISLVLAAIVFAGLLITHKSAAPDNQGVISVKVNAFNVGHHNAMFLGARTSQRRIQKDKSSGGGGSGGMGGGAHMSGGGTMHGGGGRGF